MPHQADTTVICECGAMVCKYYMPKHLGTAKHERDMVGRENVQIPEHLSLYVCMYILIYVGMYVRIIRVYTPGAPGVAGEFEAFQCH